MFVSVRNINIKLTVLYFEFGFLILHLCEYGATLNVFEIDVNEKHSDQKVAIFTEFALNQNFGFGPVSPTPISPTPLSPIPILPTPVSPTLEIKRVLISPTQQTLFQSNDKSFIIILHVYGEYKYVNIVLALND